MPAPLPDIQVREIREQRHRGDPIARIADRHGISTRTVTRIVHGEVYKHLPVYEDTSKMNERQVTDEELETMRRRWANGDTQTEIARDYGLTRTAVQNYVAGHRMRPGTPQGIEYQRVMPHVGARYRDALLRIAQGEGEPAEIACEALAIGSSDREMTAAEQRLIDEHAQVNA